MASALTALPRLEADQGAAGAADGMTALYDEHAAFVWRNLRRLGVRDDGLDDATQDVFLVVHRRWADLPRERPRSWLYGIVRRVAADHRRTRRRRGAEPLAAAGEPVAPGPTPEQRAEQAEAMRVVYEVLGKLPEEQREVFVLAELEQMTAPEIAEAVGTPVNTVYSRLRVARAAFDEHAARLLRARERGAK
jgi:RNA polymerase sigma-70 factor, ECF subfamily